VQQWRPASGKRYAGAPEPSSRHAAHENYCAELLAVSSLVEALGLGWGSGTGGSGGGTVPGLLPCLP